MRRLPATTTSPLSVALDLFRKERGFTYPQAAKELGISDVTLRRLIAHGRSPTIQVLFKLIDYFGWTADEVGVIAMYEGPVRHRGDKDRDATAAAEALRAKTD